MNDRAASACWRQNQPASERRPHERLKSDSAVDSLGGAARGMRSKSIRLHNIWDDDRGRISPLFAWRSGAREEFEVKDGTKGRRPPRGAPFWGSLGCHSFLH